MKTSTEIRIFLILLLSSVLILAGCAEEIVPGEDGTEEVEKPAEDELEVQLREEREALIMLFGTLMGDYWSTYYKDYEYYDKPVGEWTGVTTDEFGRVRTIWITPYYEARLTPQIGAFKNLKELVIRGSGSRGLLGELPKELADCKELVRLELPYNKITSIPEELSECRKLRWLDLSRNALTNLPIDLGNTDLEYLNVSGNNMEGRIPPSITENERLWARSWGDILQGNNFETYDMYIPSPKMTVEDSEGNIINLEEEYGRNRLTVLFQWGNNNTSMRMNETLMELHDQYGDAGLNVISMGAVTSNYEYYKDYFGIVWRDFQEGSILRGAPMEWTNLYDNDIYLPKYTGYPTSSFPFVTMVNRNGKVVYNSAIQASYDYERYIEIFFGSPSDDADVPVIDDDDGLADGTVKMLQRAKEGSGIDLVLMGDAFTREAIDNGTYREKMKDVMEDFFAIEPFKTYRDLFNVHVVYVHSGADGWSSSFSTWISSHTVGGKDEKVFSYAVKAVPEDRLERSVIIVTINNSSDAKGTSYMYRPEEGDCGNGKSIAYLLLGKDPEKFKEFIWHEACGHCFGKLADEYAFEEDGEISPAAVDDIKRAQKLGWYKNVDFTSDPSEVRWSRFINDERYNYESIGVYESAMNWWTGIWKPTVESVMRYGYGRFNAPSREAIYYRIHKLAYGDGWEYDYEKFVEYDKVNGPQ